MNHLIRFFILILVLSPFVNLNAHIDNGKDHLSIGWFSGNIHKEQNSIPKTLLGRWMPVSPRVSQDPLLISEKSVYLSGVVSVWCTKEIVCYYEGRGGYKGSIHTVKYHNNEGNRQGFAIHYIPSSDTLTLRSMYYNGGGSFTTHFKRSN